jgi:hypothetical protein
LSEELVAFAFFDDNVSFDTKRMMLKALHKHGSQPCTKRITIKPDDVNDQLSLDHFVTANTRMFLTLLQIQCDFLEIDPIHWADMEQYQHGKEIAQSLKVVNDAAERGVVLIQNFNSILTQHEEQKQYLLQVVEDHRHKFPDSRKATLFRAME